MPVKWTDSATLKLVFLYGRYECLCNPCHPDFSNQICCYRAYKEIVDCLNIPGLTACDCVKRIAFVKRQYCYELGKIEEAISRGQCYTPKPSWFGLMHASLFPYIQSQPECTENYTQEYDCPQDYGDVEYDEGNTAGDDCDCPPCDCPPSEEPDSGADTYSSFPEKRYPRPKYYGGKFCDDIQPPTASPVIDTVTRDSRLDLKHVRVSSRSGRREKLSTQRDYEVTEKISRDRGNKQTVGPRNCAQSVQTDSDFANRTCRPVIRQIGAQTDRKSVSHAHVGCLVPLKEASTQNSECGNRDGFTDAIDGSVRKCDEFDLFAKSIACQLQTLTLETAVNLEKRIQDMLTETRLCAMKKNTVSDKTANQCNFDCNACCSTEKEEICSYCGLPVLKCSTSLPAKASRCCSFCCG